MNPRNRLNRSRTYDVGRVCQPVYDGGLTGLEARPTRGPFPLVQMTNVEGRRTKDAMQYRRPLTLAFAAWYTLVSLLAGVHFHAHSHGDQAFHSHRDGETHSSGA